MKLVPASSAGTAPKTRRATQGKTTADPDAHKDPEALNSTLNGVLERLNKLEGSRPLDSIEFDVTCPANGNITLAHGFKGPIRWYVTSWRRKTNAGRYNLSEVTVNVDPKTLVLASRASGQAVIRVEALQSPPQLRSSATADGAQVDFSAVPGAINTLLTSDGAGGFGSVVAVGANKTVVMSNGTLYAAGAPGSNHDVIVNSSSTLVGVAPSTSGNVLTSDGTNWVSQAVAAVTPGSVGAVLRGAYGSKPSAGTANRIYLCTDTSLLLFDDGASWLAHGTVTPFKALPTAASFTIRETGANGTLTDDKGTLLFEGTKRVATDDRIFANKTFPSGGTAYTLTVGMQVYSRSNQAAPSNTFAQSYSIGGIGNYRTSTGTNQWCIVYSDSGLFKIQKGNAATLVAAASTNFTQDAYTLLGGDVFWLRVVDDGATASSTNVTWSASSDGMKFFQLWQDPRNHAGAGTGPNEVGFIVNPFNNNASVRIFSYELT